MAATDDNRLLHAVRSLLCWNHNSNRTRMKVSGSRRSVRRISNGSILITIFSLVATPRIFLGCFHDEVSAALLTSFARCTSTSRRNSSCARSTWKAAFIVTTSKRLPLYASSSMDDDDDDDDDDDIMRSPPPPPPSVRNGEDNVPLTQRDIESLTVPQLKQQLRLRRLKVSGRKKELQERLLLHGSSSKAVQFAKEQGKELVDVTAYLDDDENDGEEDSSSSSSSSTGATFEVWGRDARIVDDYEGRRVVVDNLSRTIVEYKGSNQTDVQAFVVASRDALVAFLRGGEKGQNKTSSAEETLREIQSKREVAAKIPVRFEDDEGLDEGDETGLYKNVIERDFSDWGKFTQTGAQLSASEVQGILLLSDVYGPFTEDTRALAERIAFECQPVVVMVPDLFRGHAWKEVPSTPGKNSKGQTYEQWRAAHSDLRVSVDIRAAAACLRERYGVSSVVVWGTCYGGGRALEAASGVYPDDIVHDVDGSIGPPPVDPMAAIAWYPTRYNAKQLFGKQHRGLTTNIDGEKRNVAVMAIFAGRDTIAGATPEDAASLKSLLEEDERIKDHMIKVFPDQDHGFAHSGISVGQGSLSDETERFIDEEFGGSGRIGMDGGDADVACLLSTAWMETYSRVFLPTTGPAVSKDDNEGEWRTLDMKSFGGADDRDIRAEIEDALDNFVEEPLGGRRIDQADESQRDELAEVLRTMQNGEEEGPYTIKAEDDLTTIYAKLKASDENFQIF